MEISEFHQRGDTTIDLTLGLTGKYREDGDSDILLTLFLLEFDRNETQQQHRIDLSHALSQYFQLSGDMIRNPLLPSLQSGRFSGSFQFIKSGHYRIEASCGDLKILSPLFEINILQPSSCLVSSLTSDETVAAQNLFNLLKWKPNEDRDFLSVDAVAGLMAIQKHALESSTHLPAPTLPPLQYVIQDYHVRGPSDQTPEGVTRWYKDEGRKDESNIEFMVLIRDMEGNKVALPEPVVISARGCYEDGSPACSVDGGDVFDVIPKRSRVEISRETDFAIICGRFREVSKKHQRKNFAVNISSWDPSVRILPKRTPPVCVASKRRLDPKGEGGNTATRGPQMEIQPTCEDSVLKNPAVEDPLPFCYPLADLHRHNFDEDDSCSSHSSHHVQSKKRKLTASEWLETVLKVTDQLRWTAVYYDEATETEHPVAPGNPNKAIDELLRDCPVETAESGVAAVGDLQHQPHTHPMPLLVPLDNENTTSNKE